jgi:DNA-binding transcriptional LysR family regulator
MNLYHLKTFYHTAKFRSFTKAADELCITQPAVTRQIQELQSHYDLILFNRVGKKIILTDAGETLYSLAEKIFELETQVEESIRDFQQQKSGKISVVTTETFGAFYLPEIVINFYRKFPDIYVSVLTLTDGYVIDSISKLTNDLGFISKEIAHPKIVVKEILKEEIVLVTDPDNPIAKISELDPSELNNLPIIMPEVGCGSRKVINDFKKRHNIGFNVVCEFSNNDAIKKLVREGMGITLISKNAVQNEIRRGDLVAIGIDDPNLVRRFYLTYHKEKYFTKSIAEFIAITNQWAGDYMKTLTH